MKKIKFGTGGFRGVIGDDFNKENIRYIAQALSDIILANEENDAPVVVGYDNRFLSDFSAKWFIEVLNGNGISTILQPWSVPTPVIMSAVRDGGNHYGAMMTASHNPYYFNGIKIFTKEGYDADVNFTNRLEKAINEVKVIKEMPLREAKEKGLYREVDNTRPYIRHIRSFIDPSIKNNNLRVLYDNMNGVGIIGLGPLSKELKIKKFDILNEDHDAFFSFNLPNPTKEALSTGFAETVVHQNYDFGMATDSDGDRLGVIDEKGNYLSNNEIMGAIYNYLVTKRGYKGDIVKNCATSVFIDMVAEKLGYKCHEVDVGFKNITSKMSEVNALLGGESSGGLTMRGYLFGKDASFAGSLFMEMVIKENKPVSEIISSLKKEVGYDLHFVEGFLPLVGESETVIKKIEENPPSFPIPIEKTEHYTRNFKFYLGERQWVLLRLSGTEPAFRLFAEVKDAKLASSLVNLLEDYIAKIEEMVKKEKQE